MCALLCDPDAKEPDEIFDTLEKFIRRFEAVSREVDDARREAAQEQQRSKKPAKRLLKSRSPLVPGTAVEGRGPRRIGFRKAQSTPVVGVTGGAGGSADAPADFGGGEGTVAPGIPQRRLSSNSNSKRPSIGGASIGQLTAAFNSGLSGISRSKKP